MKYVYLNLQKNRVVCVAKNSDPELSQTLTEYAISDSFDMDKVLTDDEGNEVRITGAITAAEFLSRFNEDYVQRRVSQYPALTDQLDMLWHAMDADESKRLEPFYSSIKEIKDANPKPEV